MAISILVRTPGGRDIPRAAGAIYLGWAGVAGAGAQGHALGDAAISASRDPDCLGAPESYVPFPPQLTPRTRYQAPFPGAGSAASVAEVVAGVQGPTCGMAAVYIDGIYEGSVDLFHKKEKSRQVVFKRQKISSGTGVHTIRIVVLGTSDKKSSNFDIPLDAFELIP